MAIRLYDNKYGDRLVTTNANQVLTNISNTLRKVMNEADNISETVARQFAYDARDRLRQSGYTVDDYVGNIEWKKSRDKTYWTIGFKDNDEKDVMYYLEYGTGFVGRDNPHPEAANRGWRYAINENAKNDRGDPLYFDMTGSGKTLRERGLYSMDAPMPAEGTKGWIFRDPETGTLVATSGLRAVAYMYYTWKDADNIKAKAIRESKIKSIIKGGR